MMRYLSPKIITKEDASLKVGTIVEFSEMNSSKSILVKVTLEKEITANILGKNETFKSYAVLVKISCVERYEDMNKIINDIKEK